MSRKIALMMPAALVGFLLTGDIFLNQAHAGDQCLVAPNSAPPSGSHWYYRLEHPSQRKCWYIGPEGREVRSASPKIRAAVKTTGSPAASAAGEQQKPSEQIEGPPMPALPAIAAGDPATPEALVAQTSDPRTTTIAVQREKFLMDVSAVQAHSATESLEAHAGAEAEVRPATVKKDTVKSAKIPPVLVLVVGPAALAFACVLVHAIFPAPFGRRQVHVDRRDANWGATVQSERAPTDVKSAISAPDQPTAQIGLPDDLKRKLQQILQSIEVRVA
jgi:hypothetical protein